MRYGGLILMLVVLLMPSGLASAQADVETIVAFDATQGQLPEGIAADHQGNLYVSLAPLGQIWRLDPDGQLELLTSLVDSAATPLALGALGLTVDRTGDIYVALASFDPATHGVWRISHGGTIKERLAGTEAIVLPNALAFDTKHNLYVTDSILGTIWKIPDGGTGHVWLQDPLLVGVPGLIPGGAPIGANGIAYWNQTLVVANTTTKTVVQVPLLSNGTAGNPSVMQTFEGFLDGITVDARGDLYLPILQLDEQHTIVHLSRTGQITILATAADGLDFPAGLTFGTSHGMRHTLFVTNFAVFPSANAERSGPGVVAIDLGPPHGGRYPDSR